MSTLSRSILLAAMGACSSAPRGSLQIVTPDGEVDTFSRDPRARELRVDAVDASGSVHTLASATLPTSSIDLGSLDPTSIATLVVSGTDDKGGRVLFGQSLPLRFGALDGITLPIFVQRTGGLATLPKPLSDARPWPSLAILGGRYLLVAGGRDPAQALTTQIYDFVQLTPVAAPPKVNRAAKSMAVLPTAVWLIDDGGATAFDFSGQLAAAEVTPPAGGSLGEVAGGATIVASDGSQYVVGATRLTGSPTATVLVLDPSGNPSWMTLAAPRLGAAAAWVEGRGLVVAGGSATAPGVEIVGIGSPSGTALAYPPDPSSGLGAAKIDAQHVLLCGGVSLAGKDTGVRQVDLGCAAQCAPAPWGPLPVALASTQAFVSDQDPSHALVVGNEPNGTTRVFRVAPTGVEAIATKAAHTGACATRSPIGSVVLFGGANQIESFVP